MITPNFILIEASADPLRRFLTKIGIIKSRYRFTYRLPFMQAARITYPDGTPHPTLQPWIRHEMHHVRQLAPWYGPWWVIPCVLFFPLPVLFSGRWWVERGPYLDNIKQRLDTVESVVEDLWHDYGYCWPKPMMRKWFKARLP